ncbi:MAG TPA: MoxR family ATPase [Candidatus Polarisedimenticolia bacterium]|nr:MoxR family ATPase [Candidatus Polarisedimenticolia bacterium]
MEAHQTIRALRRNIESVVRGKEEAVRLAVVCLLARGHLLIEDIPGVGKTTLAGSLARSLGCTFRRIQFTSDLLPSDIIGVAIFEQEARRFQFRPGPLFSNIVLADEINRTTPRTQSALLEAMSEFRVSVDSASHPLPDPFFVIATQNPIEHHGTYPLPDSQLDRFLMRIRVGYPDGAAEKEILARHGLSSPVESLQPVVSAEEVLALQRLAHEVAVDEAVLEYIVAIARQTRDGELIELGVSPRGSVSLCRAAQAHALVDGRTYVTPDDVKAVAVPVLEHRLVLRDGAARRHDAARLVLEEILQTVDVPL